MKVDFYQRLIKSPYLSSKIHNICNQYLTPIHFKQALDDFKGKKIKIGRARMFEDKTKDLDDPGMFALKKLSEQF